MVIPVVMIGYVIFRGIVAEYAFLKPEKVAFSIVPKMIVGKSNVFRGLAVKGAVSLGLVRIGSRISVKEVVIMNPDIAVVLL